MKKIIAIVTCFLTVSLSGCNKFLEVTPDMRTELNSVEKVAGLLVTAYPQATYMAFAEAASDNAGDKGVGRELNVEDDTNFDAYNFIPTDNILRDSPIYYWNACYAAIAASNHALQYIEKQGGKPEFQPYKGEALLCRAYAHFMLTVFFASAYDPATAGSVAGVPYVTEPETKVVQSYERGTLADTYARIEQDLLEGMPLLDDKAYKVPKYHFNREAANAFASRFYLFKRDYEKVIAYATNVPSGGNFEPYIRDWITGLNLISSYVNRGGVYEGVDQKANLLMVQAFSLYARNYWRYRFGLTNQLTAAIKNSRNVTGASRWGQIDFRSASGSHDMISKYTENFVYTNYGAGQGNPYILFPALVIEEVLLNRAEAYCYQGQFDLALADLNLYASKRIVNYSSTAYEVTLEKIREFYNEPDPKTGLIKTVLDFRRAEFIHEGVRWFDILRHGLPVEHTVLKQDGSVESTIKVEKDDPRRIFRPPNEVTLSNISID